MTKAEIRSVRSLDDKRAREETGLFVAEGEKLVRELLASDFRVRRVYCTGGDFGAATEHVPPREMERASRLRTATGVLALVEIPRRRLDEAALRGRLTLALDGVQNPGNMGTIIRLADWFGIRDVLCSADSADCWNPKVVQATMGAITRVAVHYGDLGAMVATAAADLSAPGPLPVYGTFLEGESVYDAGLSAAGIVVLGSEGRGISAEIERLVTRKIFIPPHPAGGSAPESLNVAVAAAIVCSEFRRRR
ncbi:MAG: RNA methyltransferase [Alistipes sp.]|jgi:TrmH family RNA methyltransferase|nr:RNA methyltransferase [Alistipes sp.]